MYPPMLDIHQKSSEAPPKDSYLEYKIYATPQARPSSMSPLIENPKYYSE